VVIWPEYPRSMCADGFSQAKNEDCPRKTGPDRPSFGRECPFKLEPAYTPAPPARLADGLELESAPIRSLGPAPREQAAVMLKAVSFQLVPPLPAFFGRHSAAEKELYHFLGPPQESQDLEDVKRFGNKTYGNESISCQPAETAAAESPYSEPDVVWS